MKKLLAALLALSAGAFFADCGGAPDEGDDKTDPTVYTVPAAESDFYDVGWHTTQATAGTASAVEFAP